MSILFVLLTFLVVISVNYLWFRPAQVLPVTAHPSLKPPVPLMTRQAGFAIPQDYCFHPGHTWVLREGHEDARVGFDSVKSSTGAPCCDLRSRSWVSGLGGASHCRRDEKRGFTYRAAQADGAKPVPSACLRRCVLVTKGSNK